MPSVKKNKVKKKVKKTTSSAKKAPARADSVKKPPVRAVKKKDLKTQKPDNKGQKKSKKAKSPPLKKVKSGLQRDTDKPKKAKTPPLKKVKSTQKPDADTLKKTSSVEPASVEKIKKPTKKQARLLDEHEKKWNELYKRARGISPVEFKVSAFFEAKSPLNHPQFGWGWVLKNTNHRLEVIFRDKVRLLLSGQVLLKGSEKS